MVLDAIRNVFPDNIVGAAIQHTRTITTDGDETVELTNASIKEQNAALNITSNDPLLMKKTVVIGGVNVVGILTYSAVFGVFLGRMGKHGSVALRFFNAINTVTIHMVQLAMWFSPLGTMSMITGELLSSVSLSETGEVLVLYIVTELTGLVVHSLLATPLLYLVLTRTNPFRVLGAAGQALITAFATSSSLTAILGSIGAAGVPGTGITALLLVLNAVGLPDTGISYLLTIDWLTDRIRTSVNVAGDCLAVGVVSHFTKEAFAKSNVLSLEEQDEDSNSCANENDVIVL
ncbi:excitatory amino acid transporter 2-like [Haliotis rubra]|uniref:excitatory amino acid transporter 2-like n=1 Tax=Haliotis rubra TaxID=36100 RepID=UPI001EE5960A|nr:excitatory amino acid transporter 2-like [Haliotis rubra]